MSGGKDGQTLFHRILPATAMGLTSKTAVNWHLKVKDIEYNVGLTKSYCITVSMQNISSVHKLIQQILGFHELNGHTQFWPHSPKNYWNYFLAFLNLHQHAKIKFIPSIHSWDTVNFRVLWPGWSHPSLTTPTPKFFDQILIYVNLCHHLKNQGISLICSGDTVD